MPDAAYLLVLLGEQGAEPIVLRQVDIDVLLDAGEAALAATAPGGTPASAEPGVAVAELHVPEGARLAYRGRELDEEEAGRLLSAGIGAALRAASDARAGAE